MVLGEPMDGKVHRPRVQRSESKLGHYEENSHLILFLGVSAGSFTL
jgi:hypothetical protein